MTKLKHYVIALIVGFLGVGLFQVTACTTKDLTFLHAARVATEYQASHPQQPSK